VGKNKKLFYLFLFTIEPLLILIAFAVFMFQKKPFLQIFVSNINPVFQLLTGCASGLLITFPLVYIYKSGFFSDVMDIFTDLISGFGLNIVDFILISVTAGVCEEILFRATLQPMLGIWLSSFIFILLHGYFNPKNLKILLFGVIMFVISVLIGSVYKWLGLFAAIGFHFAYDFRVLWLVSGFINNKSSRNTENAI
jgi:membrane protease YdiL (CAAX protease family)